MKKINFLACILIMMAVLSQVPFVLAAEAAVDVQEEINLIVDGTLSDVNSKKSVSLRLFQGETLPEDISPLNAAYFTQTEADETGYYKFDCLVPKDYYVAYIVTSEGVIVKNYYYDEFEGYEADILNENFESYSGGKTLKTMSLAGNNVSMFSKGYDEEKQNSYIALDPLGGTCRIYKTFDEIKSGKYEFSFKFMTDDLSFSTYARFMTTGWEAFTSAYSDNMRNTLVFSGGTYKCYLNSTGFTKTKDLDGTYGENEWHDVSMWLDMDKKWIYYFVDGNYIGKETFNTVDGVIGLSFTFGSKNGSKFCFDDFLIRRLRMEDILAENENADVPGELLSEVEFFVTSENIGNIFYEGEKIKLDIKAKNKTIERKDENVTITVTDYKGNTVQTSEQKISLSPLGEKEFEFVPETDDFGVYDISIAYGEGVSFGSFSYTRKSDNISKKYGTNLHSGYGYGFPRFMMPLVRNAGLGITRDSWSWNEDSTGVYSYDAESTAFKEYVDYSMQLNIEMLARIPYLKSGVSGDALYERIEKFAEEFAYTNKDKIKYIEFGNEPNIQNLTPEEYWKRLKSAYKGIKKGNPDAVFVGFATSRVDIAYIEDAIKLSIAEAKENGTEVVMPFDAISVHPYHDVLESVQQHKDHYGKSYYVTWAGYGQLLEDLVAKYNLDVELWGTELGWRTKPSAESTAVERDVQAQNYIKNFVINDANNLFDRLTFYEFQDSGWRTDYRDDMMGIIETFAGVDTPYGAKPAYVATAAFNDLVGNSECEGMKKNWLSTCCTEYKGDDGSNIYVLWNSNYNTTYSLELPGIDSVIIYDMFGNGQEALVSDGVLKIDVGAEPKYVKTGDFSVDAILTDNNIDITFKNAKTVYDVFVAEYIDDRLFSVEKYDTSASVTYNIKGENSTVKIFAWGENQMPILQTIEF